MRYVLYSFIIAVILTGCGGSSPEKSSSVEPAPSMISKENYIQIAQFQFQQLSFGQPSESKGRAASVSPHNPSGTIDTSGANTLRVKADYSDQQKITGFTVINGNHTLKVVFDTAGTSVTITLSEAGSPIESNVMDMSAFRQLAPDENYQEGDAS